MDVKIALFTQYTSGWQPNTLYFSGYIAKVSISDLARLNSDTDLSKYPADGPQWGISINYPEPARWTLDETRKLLKHFEVELKRYPHNTDYFLISLVKSPPSSFSENFQMRAPRLVP
jgi:hypothetical protein